MSTPGDPVRDALAELVACKDLKDSLPQGERGTWGAVDAWNAADGTAKVLEYNRRQPLAWEAARRALSSPQAGMSVSDQDTAISLLDTTANMLRGMTMDPAIPKHAKEAMWSRIGTLEAFVEHALDGGGNDK